MTVIGTPTTTQKTNTICQARIIPSIRPLRGEEGRMGSHLDTTTAAKLERAPGNIAAHVMFPRPGLVIHKHDPMDARNTIHIPVLTRGNATTTPLTGTSHHHTRSQTPLQHVPGRDQPEPARLSSTPPAVPVQCGPALLISTPVPGPVLDQPEVSPTTTARPNQHRHTPTRRGGTSCRT